MNSGLCQPGYFLDEEKYFSLVISTADLAKLDKLEKRRKMLKNMVITLTLNGDPILAHDSSYFDEDLTSNFLRGLGIQDDTEQGLVNND